VALIGLCVTGGIGAYKAVEVCRGLQKQGHEVVACMTRSATRFVTPLTFEAITRRPVVTSQWRAGANADIEHIALADRLDLLLVAPCTANVLGKLAAGIADDFLTTLYLATRAPVLLAPAMNSNMLAHPAVQDNLLRLRARGVRLVEPGEGYLACGWIGKGRLAEVDAIVEAADALVRPVDGRLKDVGVLVTAGPTYEDIDPVRFVGNRSSGRMGFALAQVAARRGARVTLVAGPTRLVPPAGVEVVQVRSAEQMHDAVMARAGSVEVIVMAAAVADYTPASPQEQKIAKGEGPLTLTLRRTPDILADLGRLASRAAARTPVLVGFAAETGDVVARARQKLERKAVDLIVANDVTEPGAGFDVETNVVTLIAEGLEERLERRSKYDVAENVLSHVERLLRQRAGSPPRVQETV
jgi:phosphopantothenoylcysteine decarboxylase/phosphopantothenate--cysteine ligase